MFRRGGCAVGVELEAERGREGIPRSPKPAYSQLSRGRAAIAVRLSGEQAGQQRAQQHSSRAAQRQRAEQPERGLA